MSLSEAIKAEAIRLGFSRVGIVRATPACTHAFYEAWLARGYAGEMGYLHRHAGPKRDPGQWAEGMRSVICLAAPYAPLDDELPDPGPEPALTGRVSRYALARDYHDVLGERLEALARFIQQKAGRPVRTRCAVDASPVMEREFAARAGLGWVGRNAMLIDWTLGSYLFLAELLVELELDFDAPHAAPAASPRGAPPDRAALPAIDLGLRESCGTCRACIDACPTAAIVADKTVDARRCISYLTIELKGPIPDDLRAPMGQWVFGCDICQEVCPWNRRVPEREPAVHPDLLSNPAEAQPDLLELLRLDDAAFRERFRHRPQYRARRRGLLRNAAVALGNGLSAGMDERKTRRAVVALEHALHDAEAVIRGAAAWALGRTRLAEASQALRRALDAEADVTVRHEMEAALRAGDSRSP